ncbi:MAG: molybdate ABC transporter substrate-binding protein [Clostridiales bacterium]|nr:molybdate ABC transporter substrate-binding protein [Clostridiales bacterium]
MKKRLLCVLLCIVLVVPAAVACSGQKGNNEPGQTNGDEKSEKQVTILVAAAASLRYCMEDELKGMFEGLHPNIRVTFTLDSSGKLQKQIEEGADVDVFVSAARKQMDALNEKGLILADSVIDLLENKIVLILPESSTLEIENFNDILLADTIAVGDPESVPAGQYAKEALENLGLWDKVKGKASFGTNVTEVLNWVAEGSAEAGIVYATDAATTGNVRVAAEAPDGSVSKIIYPAGIVNSSTKKEAAASFMEFLKSDEALAVFEKYGFTPNI